MMHGSQKSDWPIVPMKLANKTGMPVAEPMEGRGRTKGNAGQQSTDRTQSREAVSQAQGRIRGAVNRNGTERLTALFHHLNIDVLRGAFFALNRNASAGIDKETWADYEQERELRLRDLHARLHRGAYRALPSRRVMIPKPDGGERPLGIVAIEDKIVQMAVVMILTPIYEAEFLGFSYGFRPGRSQHDALDALAYGLKSRSIAWVLDADIRSFFDKISHEGVDSGRGQDSTASTRKLVTAKGLRRQDEARHIGVGTPYGTGPPTRKPLPTGRYRRPAAGSQGLPGLLPTTACGRRTGPATARPLFGMGNQRWDNHMTAKSLAVLSCPLPESTPLSPSCAARNRSTSCGMTSPGARSRPG